MTGETNATDIKTVREQRGTDARCACKTKTVHLHYESQGGGEINSPHVHWIMEEEIQGKHQQPPRAFALDNAIVGDEVAQEVLPAAEVLGLLAHAHVPVR